jgi:formylglycine-generating enzyme required for sulfatase activity
MKTPLILILTILMSLTLNAQSGSCEQKYIDYNFKIEQNQNLFHSYNKMVSFYNELSDCILKDKDRKLHELYLSELKTIDSLHCVYENDKESKQEVLKHLDTLKVKNPIYRITKENLINYVEGGDSYFSKSCEGFQYKSIETRSRVTSPNDNAKNSKSSDLSKTEQVKENIEEEFVKENTVDTKSVKEESNPKESPKEKLDDTKEEMITLDLANQNMNFNELYLDEDSKIYLSADKTHFLEFCMVNEGSFNLGITSKQYNESLIEAGEISFELNIQDEVIKKGKRLTTVSKKFFISKYELSVAQYHLIVNGETIKNDLPFTGFTKKQLEKLLNKLNSLFPNLKFDIPSEIEWEYAAKGSGEKYYMSTNNYFDIDDKVVVEDTSGPKPIMQYCLPSHVNACNMIGNVKEICRSNNEKYTQIFNQFDYVARGGSFAEDKFSARTTSRHLRKRMKSDDIGIRLIIRKK